MKIKSCISYLLVFTLFLTAEDLPHIERNFIDLLQTRSQKAEQLKEIQSRLSKLADKIDSAKEASPRDEAQIRRLMASGIPISDSLSVGESELDKLDKQIEGMQSTLVRLYKEELDSLRSLLNTGSDEKKTVLNNRVELISQKYMLLNPAIRQLSFDPAKLRGIELADIADPIEQDILSAFLKKSLLEVESRIQHIQNDLKEIEPFVKLDEKTREFLEEVDGENFLLLGGTESGTTALNEFQTNDGQGNDIIATALIEQNAFSIEQLINQLEISDFTLEKTVDGEGSFLQPQFSSSDYVKLLREIEDQLKSVRSEIRDRLQEVNP